MLTALAVAAGLIAAVPAQAAPGPPSPGDPGLGDRLFPELGNGGYDTRHYDLSMSYATDAPDTSVSGEVDIRARAEQSLSSFNLDFDGDSVEGVWVNGRRAEWTLDGEELVITPRRPLRNRERFHVTVDFTGHPVIPAPDDNSPSAGSPPSTGRSRPASPTVPTRSSRPTTIPPTRPRTRSASRCPRA